MLLISVQIELVDPERDWTVTQRFFSLQSDIDVKIKWRDGQSLRDMDTDVPGTT